MAEFIDCPWCGIENALDFCDSHSIGLNEVECDGCHMPFHFEAEPSIHIGTAFKTLPVKECKCPRCGFDYSSHVGPGTRLTSTMCPSCREGVTFIVTRHKTGKQNT